MAKNYNKKQIEEIPQSEEMTLEQAQAYRESLFAQTDVELSEEQKREQFRIFWAQNKSKYGKTKEMEDVLWLHLKSVKLNSPEDFEKGVLNFGFKEI